MPGRRVDFDGDEAPGRQVIDDMLQDCAPGVHFVYTDAEERLQIFRRELKERPLLGLEVGCEREGGRGQRFQAEGVQNLNPQVDVAIRLVPDAFGPVQRMRLVGRGIEVEQLGQCHRALRTLSGH